MHELVELADLRALNAPGGILAPWGARLLTFLAAQADMTCLTMRHYAEWMSARRVTCTYIPIGAYHEPELLEESDSHELLFFTTLAPYKGLELLLEAFCRLRADDPRLRLTIAGAEHTRFPNYAVKLKSQFNEADGVRWSGQIPEDQVKDFFRRSQIIVLPYTASTGASSVLYQAATWGRAIVASDLDEIGSLANESNLQVEFFKNGNVVSLCNSIRALLDSPARRRDQATHNLESIQHTRPEETCRKYIQVFNLALEKRQRTKRIPMMESA
jgi:glycosyltransferase involved in cell wall biosynthesis